MKQDFKAIGQLLKQRRTELSLSLKEAQNATSIQIGHLQAIEEGIMEKLISPVYAQGFVKQYARFLGLDGDKIVRENPDIFVVRAKAEFDYGIGTMELRATPGSGGRSTLSVLWIAAFGVLALSALLALRFLEIL